MFGKRQRRKEYLGENIITLNGIKVVPLHYNFSENFTKLKCMCSCYSIVLTSGYPRHISTPKCINFHKIINKDPIISNYLTPTYVAEP